MKILSATKYIAIIGVLAASLVGCGGSGSTPPMVGPSGMKAEVIKAVAGGFNAKSTGQSQGTGGKRIARRDGVSYDSFYELYQQYITTNPLEIRVNYFVDEALTQPAGFQAITISANGDTGIKACTINITAGPRSGHTAEITSSYVGGRSEFSYRGTDPKVGTFVASGFFEDGAGEYRTADTDLQGVKREYIASYSADGTSRVEYDSPTSFRYTLNYAADQSGTGTVTGNSTLLPATIQWNAQGTGDITFADGTKVTFENFNFNQI